MEGHSLNVTCVLPIGLALAERNLISESSFSSIQSILRGREVDSIVWETWDYGSKAGKGLVDGGGELGKAKEIFLDVIFVIMR
jgi:hypothetical protein